MKFSAITYPDVNNGVGCRVTLWTQGCPHKCVGCHNPETWDATQGREFTDEDKERLFEVLSKKYIKGLTLSGGDPLLWYKPICELMKEVKESFPEKDIWIWTGYIMAELKERFPDVLKYADVIIDGVFILEERDLSLKWRGSKNQVIWEKDENDNFIESELNK